MLISGLNINDIEGNKYDMICIYNVIYMYIKLFLHYHTLHCHLLRTVLVLHSDMRSQIFLTRYTAAELYVLKKKNN
jgi:hypothetical protein